MNNVFTTAIAVYESCLAEIARRAGATAAAPLAAIETVKLEQAARLAMGGVRQQEKITPPSLTSIAGELFGEKRRGFYSPAIVAVGAAEPSPTAPANLTDHYRQLWQQLSAERARLVSPAHNTMAQEANLHALLQRYAWAMAAPLFSTAEAAANTTDVSLFDYARVTAAIAGCLQDASCTPGETALLVGADISGVQDWLYTFGSAGAARSLRGRSFYLQLLSEVVALFVLQELELPMSNLLYAGGGNFYILAPVSARGLLFADSTGAAEGRSGALQEAITRKLLAMHDGALYMALEAVPVSAAQFTDHTIGHTISAAWDSVNRRLNTRKRRRFTELDDEQLSVAIGSPLAGTGLPKDTCRVCRRSIHLGERGRPVDDADGGRVCDQCLSFEHLGNALRTAEFLVMATTAATAPARVTDWQAGLRQFGVDVQLVEHANENPRAWQPPPDASLTRINFWRQQMPDLGEFPGHPEPTQTVWTFRPLAQCVPVKDGEIATFEDLESDGVQRWGVLRMDVDNLGQIFQRGIPATNLCRVVGLSSLLRLFFEGDVPLLAEKYNRHGPRMYLMYAGGDDLFLVGGWSELPLLAADIHDAFERFACGNPRVTIRGGVSLALGDRYPIYQAAREAGEAEHQAKDAGGNRLAFLGQDVIWQATQPGDPDFQLVWARVQQLIQWIGEHGKLNRSFLMNLRAIDAEWREWKKRERGKQPRYHHTEAEIYLGPWQWHLAYSLRRAAERTHDEQLKQEVANYVAAIVAREIRVLGLTARWTELLTRKADHKSKEG